jgi:hypothetical protein
MTDQTRTYLFIALGIGVIVLIVIAVASFFTGNTEVGGAAGTAAVAAAAAATKTRTKTRTTINEGEEKVEDAVDDVHDNADAAREEMAHNEDAIPKMATDEKVALGNDLLNPNKPDDQGTA